MFEFFYFFYPALRQLFDAELDFKKPLFLTAETVFRNYALYPHMTVYKNIAFGLKLRKAMLPVYDRKGGEPVYGEDGEPLLKKRKYTRAEIDEKVMEVARMLEIED